MRNGWIIKDHAVKQFRKRFLLSHFLGKPKNVGKTLRDLKISKKETKKILYYYLRRAHLFAREKNRKSLADIYFAFSAVYGDIYFITHDNVVHTVYPEKYVKSKLENGIWQKI